MPDETQLEQFGPDSPALDPPQQSAPRERARIFITGDCDGLPDLREALAAHPDVELVGSAAQVAEAAPTLTGGHLAVVLHATRSSALPVNELAAIREHTKAPLILLASNELPGPAGGGARARRRRRPAAAADDRQRRLRDPQGGPRRPRLTGDEPPPRPDRHRVLAEGRHGQDRDRDEPRQLARQARGQADAAARPRPPVRRRGDHARDRAGEDDLRPRRRPGRARLGEARRLHDAARVRPRHPPGAAAPGGRRARDRGEARPAPGGRARVVRRDRRRHLAVLPRADAGHPRPHRRAAPRLRARRADVEERPAQPPDARAARPSRPTGSARPQPGELEGRDEAERGRAALEREIRFEVPSDRTVPLAVNRGNPAVLAEPRRSSRRRSARWRRSSSPRQAAAKQKRRSWRPWRGRSHGPPRPTQPQRLHERRPPRARRACRRAGRAARAAAGRPVRRAQGPDPPRLHREARHRSSTRPARRRQRRGPRRKVLASSPSSSRSTGRR